MDNKNINNIPKRSFGIPKDNVVNLKARANVGYDEKESEFSNKQNEDVQEFKSKTDLTKDTSQRNIFKDNSDKTNINSDYFSRYFFYFLVFLLPLFCLPFSLEIFEFNKTILLFVVSSLAFLVWMSKMIVIDKRLTFVRTPLNVPIAIFILLIFLSTILSVDKISSVLGFYGRFSDSLMVYLSFVMLYFVGVNSVVRSTVIRNDNSFTINIVKAFLASSSVVVVVSLLYFFGFKFIPWSETQFSSFNLVSGSLNILGVYLVVVIIMALFYLAEIKNIFIKYSVCLLVVISLILLAVIDFMLTWVVLAISLSVVLAFAIREHSKNITNAKKGFVPASLIILISLVFIVTSLTFTNKDVESNFKSSSVSSLMVSRIIPSVDDGSNNSGFTKEIILDKKTAASVAIGGIKEDPISSIVGTGPGTYLYNFSKFKPTEFNSNLFWSIRFDKAGSEIIEKISTIGILGTLSYLLIIVITIGMFFKVFLQRRRLLVSFSDAYLFSAWLSLLFFQFLYLGSITIKFVFWILTIVLAVKYCSVKMQDNEKNILWETKIGKSNQAFYLSLLLVIIVSITASYYYQIRFYGAEMNYKSTVLAYDKAIKDSSLTDEDAWDVLNESVKDLKEVIEKNPYNGSYRSFLSDIYFNRLAIAIQEESGKNDEERDNQRIAQEMRGVIDHAKSAVDTNPNNVVFQQKLGNIYAHIFNNINIEDADEWAIKKYDRAIELEPSNPILHIELGKIFVSQYLESKDEDKMGYAISEFEKALELKSDYIDAGLQLGLAYEIKGDEEKAISQLSSFLENGTADINIAFQLGRIHYNSGNIKEAKNIFLEIITLQPRNSNAHYSLGLIYEREENNENALKEFELVLSLNPNNQEVLEKIDRLKEAIEKGNRKPEPKPEPIIEPVTEGSTEDGAEEIKEEG